MARLAIHSPDAVARGARVRPAVQCASLGRLWGPRVPRASLLAIEVTLVDDAPLPLSRLPRARPRTGPAPPSRQLSLLLHRPTRILKFLIQLPSAPTPLHLPQPSTYRLSTPRSTRSATLPPTSSLSPLSNTAAECQRWLSTKKICSRHLLSPVRQTEASVVTSMTNSRMARRPH